MMEAKRPVQTKSSHCGVPQCNSYAGPGTDITMHRIPKKVRSTPKLLEKWSVPLKMGKPFPKYFWICSLHFRKTQIIRPPFREGVVCRSRLVGGAFPTLQLPQSTVNGRRPVKDRSVPARLLARAAAIAKRRSTQDSQDPLRLSPSPTESLIEESVTANEEIPATADNGVQVNLNCFAFDYTSLWDTDKKLSTMTGLNGFATLDALVNAAEKIRQDENVLMTMRERVLLTMHRLKSNFSFAEIAISFQISEKTAKLYFADTIQLLAKITKCSIQWQTNEQNLHSLPVCFHDFPNVKTVLDCTEIKTVSNYKETYTLKVLIGVSPSGSINFISKVSTRKSSNTTTFDVSELLQKLEPGDAVMVDKGCMIADELAKTGIEMVRPESNTEKLSEAAVERNTKIAAARVHVKRRIAKLKKFKVLSEKVGIFIVPYMDNIITVLCGLSNLSSSPMLLSNEKSLP